MKILDTTLIVDPAIQQPFTGPSLNFIENAYKEAISELAKLCVSDITKLTVLYGCVNSTPGTTTFTLSAGAVYYNGEIYIVPAATLTTSGNVVVCNLVDTNTLGNQTFSDGIARTTSHDRTGVWALGTSGTGTLSGTTASDYTNVVFANKDFGQITPTVSVDGTGSVVASTCTMNYAIKNGILFWSIAVGFTSIGASTKIITFTIPSFIDNPGNKSVYGSATGFKTGTRYNLDFIFPSSSGSGLIGLTNQNGDDLDTTMTGARFSGFIILR